MIIVSDNSALSCLAELGQLDLLQQLYGTVVITATIQQEACHPSAPPALRKFMTSMPSWLVVLPDIQPYLEETKALDPGEASAITLAWQHRETSLLIIDEKRGRRVSSALGLKITGAAGVLTDAATAGLVPFEEIFQQLSKPSSACQPPSWNNSDSAITHSLRCSNSHHPNPKFTLHPSILPSPLCERAEWRFREKSKRRMLSGDVMRITTLQSLLHRFDTWLTPLPC